jgi:hypothetical protein
MHLGEVLKLLDQVTPSEVLTVAQLDKKLSPESPSFIVMRDFSLSQRCFLRFKSFGMRRRVV